MGYLGPNSLEHKPSAQVALEEEAGTVKKGRSEGLEAIQQQVQSRGLRHKDRLGELIRGIRSVIGRELARG